MKLRVRDAPITPGPLPVSMRVVPHATFAVNGPLMFDAVVTDFGTTAIDGRIGPWFTSQISAAKGSSATNAFCPTPTIDQWRSGTAESFPDGVFGVSVHIAAKRSIVVTNAYDAECETTFAGPGPFTIVVAATMHTDAVDDARVAAAPVTFSIRGALPITTSTEAP